MRRLGSLLPLLFWASLAPAQPAPLVTGPGSLPGTWGYDIPKYELRCINAPKVLGVHVTLVIQREADGHLTFHPTDATVRLESANGSAGESTAFLPDCVFPLRQANNPVRLTTEPDTRCGNEGWGSRVLERTLLFSGKEAWIRERGTLYLWTNVCEYQVEARLKPDITLSQRLNQTLEVLNRQAEQVEAERKQKAERAPLQPPPAKED
ncbi:hypothetical protein OV208_18395 [Corallococcus sp. bb12-1]|uniref:hypothetical protein n=1 Tax=Corallococcus sp. bb12-1 TaxID=2996784 RepID=UPI00226FECEC|nr:hypothetical protein [Corallococcus sp. bb12-1]MCY1043293.1 hypothetical protein [Corallococcus sp. bb12-1]